MVNEKLVRGEIKSGGFLLKAGLGGSDIARVNNGDEEFVPLGNEISRMGDSLNWI